MPKFKVSTHTGNTFYLNDDNEIHRGGEGRILLIDNQPNKIAKIYHQGIKGINKKRFDALQKLDKSLFIIPEELLLINNLIIGYTMQFAGNDFFALASCFNKNFCKKNNCTQKIKQTIANKLINAVKQAHKQNIVLGDLNQYNVLVNTKGDIKLIDTDSYKVPGFNHSGLLLDEIRDYLYNGIVSKNSDYFALSVLLFYLFTYTHPFKGIHEKYKKLAERMIHKIPVFAKDPLLKVPKCYQALNDAKLQKHFEKLYIDGQRFLLNLSGFSVATKPTTTLTIKRLQEKDLIISTILDNTLVQDIQFNNNGGYIETPERFLVYSAKNKTYVQHRFDILKQDFNRIFVSGETVLAQKGNALYHYKNNTNIVKISNFNFETGMQIHQFEDILIAIGKNKMYRLYMNDILNTSVKNKRSEVFEAGFSHYAGLIQNTGGVQRIFYNSGKDIATVKTKKRIKALYQTSNMGIAQYIEQNKLINRYFKINGLEQEFSTQVAEHFTHFAYLPTSKQNGFIFEPTDTGINIIRSEDFKVISHLQTGVISAQSTLNYTKSGIIAWENDAVYLINKTED